MGKGEFDKFLDNLDDWKNQIGTTLSGLGQDAKDKIVKLLEQHPELINKLKAIKNDASNRAEKLQQDAKNDPEFQKLIALLAGEEDVQKKPPYNHATKMGLSAGILAFILLL